MPFSKNSEKIKKIKIILIIKMNFTNQFFALRHVGNQALITNQLDPSLSGPLDALLAEHMERLHFIEKVKLFLQLKANIGDQRHVIFNRLTRPPYNLRVSDNVLIQDEGDIEACDTLLKESARLKLYFPALEKIKLIKKLWDDMLAADSYCRSWRQLVFKNLPTILGGGDCYMSLHQAINAMKQSGMFVREYHTIDLAQDPMAVERGNVNPGHPNGAMDWFNSDVSIFRAPALRDIERVYIDEIRRKEQAERAQQLAQAERQGKRRKSKKSKKAKKCKRV
jgi:hypothetical protein